MKIKEKSKVTNILKIIVFTLILLILMLGVSTKSNAAELFWENLPLSFNGIPRYGDIGPLVFCSKKGSGTEAYIDCSKIIANALGSGIHKTDYYNVALERNQSTYTVLNEDPITKFTYKWYTVPSEHVAEVYGPIYYSQTFADEVSNFISDLVADGNKHNNVSFTVDGINYANELTYDEDFNLGYSPGLDFSTGDDNGAFDWNRITNPATGLPMLGGEGTGRPPLYSLEFNAGEGLAESEIQAELYINSDPGSSDVTKQQALWGLDKGRYKYNTGNTTAGNPLTVTAEMYENMYKKLSELMSQGMSYGEAYLSSIKANTKNVKRIDRIDIEGGNYDLYVYNNVVWKVNKNEKAYYLGPFSIDYSVVGSSDSKCVVYDYIKNVTVYNQNKRNIAELGGSFEILDKYGNVIYNGNKEDLQKIAPGQEFYIKVNMGSMEAKDFENFYAKFDFNYICKVAGSGQRYDATVKEWGWTSKTTNYKSFPLQGSYEYKYKKWVGKWKTRYKRDKDGNIEVDENGNYKKETYWDPYDHQEEVTDTVTLSRSTQYIPGYTYTLRKRSAPQYTAQQQTHLEGERQWDGSQSIVITTEWEEQDLEVDIEKICSETGKPLYGAEFNITLNIQGTDAFGNTINKQLTFTRTTDSDGIARLPKEEIEAMGVDLSTFRGTIYVTAKETYAPAGHTITQEVYTGTLTSGTLKITARDSEGQGEIKLAKIDQNGNYIDADFEVAVTEEGKDYPSIQNHKIKGSTENGVMYISREDLRTVGIDIDNFTGNLVLEIIEVKTKNGYSIRGQGKTVTLAFENGELKQYNETDDKLTVEYLYEDALPQVLTDFVEGRATLEQLPEWVRNNIQDWINKQLAREDLDMEYNEVMDWFKKYVEEHKEEIFKLMTESSSKLDSGMLQITVENNQGMELPNIPTKPTSPPNDLTMKVAGYAFLDGTETKGHAYETNGELDTGEILLGGIKVTLKEKGGANATLIQNSQVKEIRTNPTMTNDNGYYEFDGVDPSKDYYVEFEYNGMKYEASPGSVAVYNSDKWAVTAKASESNTSARSQYNTVTPATKVYSYEELEGIYNAIQTYTLSYIMNNNRYPSDSEIKNGAKQYVNNIADIDERLDYILSGSVVTATAGYGAGNSETYPHSSRKEFLMNREFVNLDKETYEFMHEQIERLYPGQLQIHLGLKERDRTDLSLTKDIVESEFDINGHKTVYKYENGNESYTEYVYEEDYRYDDKEKQNTNIAYYDDIKEEPELYITYKITVTNEMSRNTKPLEIVDYFDPNFEVVGAWIGEKNVPYSATSTYGRNEKYWEGNDAYSAVYLKPDVTLSNNSVDIMLKLKLKDAKNNLTKYIKTEKGESKVSKALEVENFAEINAYYTDGSFIDIDSHPGNLSIAKYKQALADYRQAFSDFMNTMSESAGLAAQAARDRLLETREDDAWEVSLTLINNGLKRELDGSVWEAISNDIKTASNLQNTNTLLQYVQDHGIEGITVELVELRDFGSDTGTGADTGDVKVRARTSTDSNGNYHFESYIPGNYVVRFTYGDKDNPIRSEFTKDSEGKALQINGQFYQSTKANPNTDAQEYWYAQDIGTRYSDAQDGAQSRANQIETDIKGSTGSKSNNYNYTGIVSVDSGIHQDAINAYTSSIHAEGEYTKQVIDSAFSKNNADYAYEIQNVDFGITPRAGVDLQIDKYVSNVKVYLQNKTLQLDCSFEYEEDENGNKRIKADGVHYNKTEETEELINLVIANYGSNSFLDGLIEVLMDDQLYNGAQLEVTYTISVDNKSEYDTLRWVINNGTKVGVVYYQNEDYTKLPNYEQGKVIYHNDAEQKYAKTTGTITPDSERVVKTSAVNIVDYVEPNLQFRKTNFLGEAINQDWTDTNKQEFISSRKDYIDAMPDNEAVKNEYEKLTSVYNQYIKAADGSKLLDQLEPRNTDGRPMDSYRDTTLTLVTTLGTTASDTTDYEYHNLVEIAQMANTSGRVKKVEYYDVDGKLTSSDTYTEEERDKPDDDIPYLPTIGTSKSETVVFHAPTGLPISERVQTNVIIALIALVTLAGGIVLIKKYAVKTKQE